MSALAGKPAAGAAEPRPATRARARARARARWPALAALFALAVALSGLYALVIPPWQAPDEPGHFEYAWTIAQMRRLPGPADASPAFEQALVDSLYRYRFGDYTGRPLPEIKPARISGLPASNYVARGRTLLWGRFSLGYLPPALAIALAPHAALETQLVLARLSSAALGGLIVVLAFVIFQELQPGRWRLNALGAAAVALIPQHAYLNGTVNDGTLAVLVATWVILCWVRLITRGGRLEWAGIAAGLALAPFTKATLVFLFPASAMLAAGLVLRRRGRRADWWALAVAGAALLAVAAGLLWLTPPGERARSALNHAAAGLVWRDKTGLTLPEGLLRTYDSFWATFGWMAVPVARHWYIVIDLFTLAALAGWLRRRHVPRPQAFGALCLMCGIALAAFVIGGLLTQSYYWIQGRYLFPVIVPFTFLLVNGLVRLLPTRLQTGGAAALVAVLAVFNAVCLCGYVLPYFYA
jgi:hypothetical protein